MIRGRRGRAGWWLAAATCVKASSRPLLVLYPLSGRDWRMLGHFALGVVVGVVVIPVVALGPDRAWETTETFVNQTILPGLTSKPGALSHELTDMTGTDNQSIQAIIHAAVNWGGKLPPEAAGGHETGARGRLGAPDRHNVPRGAADRGRTVSNAVPPERALDRGGRAHTGEPHALHGALRVPRPYSASCTGRLERRGEFRWGPCGARLCGRGSRRVGDLSAGSPNCPATRPRDAGMTMLGTLVVWFAALWFPAGSRVRSKPVSAESQGGFRLAGCADVEVIEPRAVASQS